MKKVCIAIGFIFLLFSCKQDSAHIKGTVSVDLDNAVVQQIFNFQTKRNTNALLPFLTVENPTHRYLAAMAFASIQDTTAIKDLADLLKDEYEEVRYAAAYSLGQIKNSKAAPYLTDAFALDSSRLVQAAILEAVGRCGTMDHLKYLAATSPYPKKDSILLEGLALGIYRFSLRGMVHKEGTEKIMNDFIANSLISPKARFIAASYLARTEGLDLKGYEKVLINNVTEEKDPNTLMFLVTALAKSKDLHPSLLEKNVNAWANKEFAVPLYETYSAQKTLEKIYFEQNDYRIRCNILRGLKYFQYDSVKTTAFKALQDSNLHVKITAAEYLYYNGSDLDAMLYFGLANKSQNWQVRAKLLAASLRNISYFKTKTKAFYSQKIISKYKASQNVYEKAALLKTLGNYSWNYGFIAKEIFPSADSIKIPEVIRSTGTESLVILRSSSYYDKELGLSKIRITNELNRLFKRCVEEGDPAMQAIAAEFFMEEKMNFKKVFPAYNFLKTAQERLSLPGNIETFIFLQKAINFFEGRKEELVVKKSNAVTEIDWQLIRILKDNPKVTIQTSKGAIVLNLRPDIAPATATQFVNLVKAKYYNNMPFHRVVPNFVAQGGCSRGDGWSGFASTVVSEFSNAARYHKAGWVGMASAGKDTESAQFFITHSPTPHLDGNYTIFAQVVQGMDVVHQMQIGDMILSIDINF